MTENVTKTIERGGPLRASTRSLHDIGLDNYPNPEFPEASRLTRKEEKSALQNLNNRLAGTLDAKLLQHTYTNLSFEKSIHVNFSYLSQTIISI